jgi:hypothetical protein
VTGEARILIAIVAASFAVYFATAPIVAHIQGEPASFASVWNGEEFHPTWSIPIVLLFALSGVAIALFVPALPWTLVLAGGHLRAASLFSRAFALNLLQAVAFISLWKALGGIVPARPVFIGWQAFIALLGIVVLVHRRARGRSAKSLDGFRSLLVAGFVLLFLLPLFLWGKVFVEDADGDGTEAFEFSRSLATHQLPYWDLENGYYGFYPNFMLFAYPTQLSFIAIGETEGGQRVPVFFYVFGVFLVLRELVKRARRRLSGLELMLLLGASVFFIVYNAFHSSYAVVVDLGEPLGVDLFFAFLAASAFYALITRQRAWWALFSLFMAMALGSGLPFTLLFLVGHLASLWPRRWSSIRRALVDAIVFLLPWCAYQLCVHIYSRSYPLGTTKWAFSNLPDRYPVQFDPMIALTVLERFGLAVGVVPFVALGLILLQRDRIARALTAAILGYLAMLIVLGRAHPHYLIPISLFPAAIYLRMLARPGTSVRTRQLGHVSYATILAVLLVMVTPQDRTPVTTYQQFGAHTLMLYDSYPDLIDRLDDPLLGRTKLRVFLPNGKAALPWQVTTLVIGLDETRTVPERLVNPSQIAAMRRAGVVDDQTPWGISYHTWIRYSDRVPVDGRHYHQILAAPHLAPAQPEGYARQDLEGGWVLFYKPEESIFAWLTSG